MHVNGKVVPTILTILGANGDLAKRKLVPALYNLYLDGSLPDRFLIIGFGREGSDESFRQHMKAAVTEFSRRGMGDGERWKAFSESLVFVAGTFEDSDAYTRLSEKIHATEREWRTKAVRIFYLSTPPQFVEMIVANLAHCHLNSERKRDRIVIEKPFGKDLESATALDRKIKASFQESQIFRIDHYLGKETVQNILAFRFANALFEPIWDRKYIDHVQITVGETVGVEKRGTFYEGAGALRDMVQNHLLQILCMIAMEPPTSFEADEVRNKKVDVLKTIRPIPHGDLHHYAVRGQYASGWVEGKQIPGYRHEEGVAPNSSTETFAALKLFVDNWRWQDVPFYLRTGKRLPAKFSQVSISFKPVPHQMFPAGAADHWEPNRLVMNIQPKEGILMRFQAKQPGRGMRLQTVPMDFFYAEAFKAEPAEAYETLLFDVMIGDGTLFMRADQEHFAWAAVSPILEAWTSTPSAGFPNYPAGTWGPEQAEALIAQDGRSWYSPPLEDEN